MNSFTEASPLEKCETIRVFINGEARDAPSGQSVEQLLAFLQLNPERVAVELNKQIVRKRNWAGTRVHDGDGIEVVEFVGGG